MFDYRGRRARLAERMEVSAVEALFVGPSPDLEYLTGLERNLPSFSQVVYAHGWITGAFFRADAEPIFVVPRMFATFHVRSPIEGEMIVVNETDDGAAVFERAARTAVGAGGALAVGAGVAGETVLRLAAILGPERLGNGLPLVNGLRRVKAAEELEAMERAVEVAETAMAAVSPLVTVGVTMGELAEAVDHELRRAGARCPSFTTHVLTGFGAEDVDSGEQSAWTPISDGTAVMFDFGAVFDGYCSDFGRTVCCGEPPRDVRDAYAVLLQAHEEGRRALRAGTPAREVNAACRRPIEEAGLGAHFRHRMGHGIGLNVHEAPFLSAEDDTVLQAGMTFTDEPSINVPNGFSVRIEDIVVCADEGGRLLNRYPSALVANPS